MALGKVKDNNTVLNIQRTQTERVNQWGYYQAKGLKENLADAMVEQLTLALVTTPGDKQTTHTARIDHFTAERARYRSQKEEIQKKAEALAEEQEALIKRHDMFDLSEAAFSIALAVFALTALTQKKWPAGFRSRFRGHRSAVLRRRLCPAGTSVRDSSPTFWG